jgi:hypothetical protein
MRLATIALLAWLSALTVGAGPAQIILLRHAEKPRRESDSHLSATGRQRAEALVGFLTTTPALTNHGAPAALFACQPTLRGHGRRPLETLQPLAIHLRLAIDTTWPANDYLRLAQHVRGDDRYSGKSVVICWVHDDMPKLAKALGVRPKPGPWKDEVYDRVWVITYSGDQVSLVDLPQRLLPGDEGLEPDPPGTDHRPDVSRDSPPPRPATPD